MNSEFEDRLYQLTGHTADLAVALDEWEAERELVKELNDVYEAQKITLVRYTKCIQAALRFVRMVEKESGLFLPPKTRDAMTEFLDSVPKLLGQEPVLERYPNRAKPGGVRSPGRRAALDCPPGQAGTKPAAHKASSG